MEIENSMEKLKLSCSENILSYLFSMNSMVSLRILSIKFKYSKSTIIRSINELEEYGLVEETYEGRFKKYKITQKGKSYIEEYNVEVISKEKLIQEEETNKTLIEADNLLEKIEELKNKVDRQEKEIALKDELRNSKVEKLEKKIKQTDEMISTFYGKIGEIITLLIGAMSIIVFNIKVMDTTKIDFTNGYKDAFLSIIAIDLPMIILLVIATVLFHYIIAKELNIKRLIVIGIIILFCVGILVV